MPAYDSEPVLYRNFHNSPGQMTVLLCWACGGDGDTSHDYQHSTQNVNLCAAHQEQDEIVFPDIHITPVLYPKRRLAASR